MDERTHEEKDEEMLVLNAQMQLCEDCCATAIPFSLFYIVVRSL